MKRTRLASRMVLLKSVVVSILSQGASAAETRLFSKGGDGQTFDALLIDSEPSGLEQNRIARVRFKSLSGKASTAEWIVNCNYTMPQVVSPKGINYPVDTEKTPATDTRFRYQLWWAVCRGEFQKADDVLSETAPPTKKLRSTRIRKTLFKRPCKTRC